MALELCNRLANNLTSRKCAVPGGTNRRSWVFQREQFTGAFTKSGTTGAISGFGLVADELGIRAVGRPKKGSGAGKGTQADTGSTEIEQTLIQEFTFLNEGQIRVYFKAFGNETATAEETTGTLLADESQVMKMTLVGKEPKFAEFFEAPVGSGGLSQLEASAAYLDALTKATV